MSNHCSNYSKFNRIIKNIQDEITEIKNNNSSKFVNPIIHGNIIPTKNKTYNLGSITKKFKELYLSGNSIHLGNKLILKNKNNNLEVISKSNIINVTSQQNSIINLENNVSTNITNIEINSSEIDDLNLVYQIILLI